MGICACRPNATRGCSGNLLKVRYVTQQAQRETVMSDARFRWTLDTTTFIALMAGLNAALYHLPLFSFATGNLDLSTSSGLLTLATVLIALFLETALLLTGLALVSHRILKPFCMLMALGNAV